MMQGRIERGAPTTIDVLEAISRIRPLTPSEVRKLDKAIRTQRSAIGELQNRPWLRGDVRRLARYLSRGKRPAQIAVLIGRTERAVWRKMYKLGWTVRKAGQGLIDEGRGK